MVVVGSHYPLSIIVHPDTARHDRPQRTEAHITASAAAAAAAEAATLAAADSGAPAAASAAAGVVEAFTPNAAPNAAAGTPSGAGCELDVKAEILRVLYPLFAPCLHMSCCLG